MKDPGDLLNILILSPHRNDAALSLGLAIKSWLVAGHHVTVLGVFTRSLTAPYSDADSVHPNDLLSYVSAMRRREDVEFQKLVPGVHMVDLNLKDALLRLRCTAAEVCTLTPSPDDTAIPKIRKVLAKLTTELAVDAVLLPLGLGHHVDHLIVRNAALAFAAEHRCAFYEDVLDALEAGADIELSALAELHVLRASGLLAETFGPTILQSSQDAAESVREKCRIVSVYPSQIDDTAIDVVSNLAANYDGGERVWANSAWLASPL